MCGSGAEASHLEAHAIEHFSMNSYEAQFVTTRGGRPERAALFDGAEFVGIQAPMQIGMFVGGFEGDALACAWDVGVDGENRFGRGVQNSVRRRAGGGGGGQPRASEVAYGNGFGADEKIFFVFRDDARRASRCVAG